MSRREPILDRFARRCTYCGEWATGYWGPMGGLGAVPPEHDEIYTCEGHWFELAREADAVATRWGDDPEGQSHRPLYTRGLQLIGSRDRRVAFVERTTDG